MDELSDDVELLAFFRSIASRHQVEIARALDSPRPFADRAIRRGARRQDAESYFLATIGHYVYEGDTALHVAAAAYQAELAERLIGLGAAVRARNRRGAEPLHYAADGAPDASNWDPPAQHALIVYLIAAGADPNALDNSGVAPLHRAVRTRSAGAVHALLDNGADVRLRNVRGSTPLHLAVQNTGRSNSGSEASKDEQRRIISLLMAHGARGTDLDANGKTVAAAASSEWIRDLVARSGP